MKTIDFPTYAEYNTDNTWMRTVARETCQREMPRAASIFVGSV